MERTRPYHRHDVSSAAFNPNSSESDIPLRPYDPERDLGSEESVHQRWDARGQAVGYAPDPRLHAPRPRPPSFKPSALYASPGAAAAVTSSRDSGDERPNAHTPKTSRPPDLATIPVPVSAPIPPPESFPLTEYPHASAPPTSSIPLPQQSPQSGHMGSSPLSTTAQYVTYQPDNFAVSTMLSKVGPGLDAAQAFNNPHATPMTGFESVPTRTFSPPPSYR